MDTRSNRRTFLKNTALGGLGLIILKDSRSARTYAANEKLSIALVGCGGRGAWFVEAAPRIGQLVAMCDVNQVKAAPGFKKFPDLPKFEDFRVMLDKMGKEIDAVIVATPDHIHAVASAAALHAGKPVYCEKGLTRTIHEARTLGELAFKQKLATQMGNQHGYDVRAVELVAAGAIGEVREAHVWMDGGGPGPRAIPTDTPPVPSTLNWDLWLGPALDRPYHPAWMGGWSGWRDFGSGMAGMWESHTMATLYKALRLDTLWQIGKPLPAGAPHPILRVTAECSEVSKTNYPRWEMIRWDVPAREGMPPVRVNYYNGPGATASTFPEERRQALARDQVLIPGEGGALKYRVWAGSMMVGTKGLLHAGGYSNLENLLPKEKFATVADPPPSLPRPLSASAERGWVAGIQGGPAPMCSFDGFAGPYVQFYLLGNVATLFPGKTLEFDPIDGKVTNLDEANEVINPKVRKGWEL